VVYRLDSLEAIKRVYEHYLANKSEISKAKIVSLEEYKRIKREKELIRNLLISKRKQEILGIK